MPYSVVPTEGGEVTDGWEVGGEVGGGVVTGDETMQQALSAQTSQYLAMFAVSSIIAKHVHVVFYYKYLTFTPQT